MEGGTYVVGVRDHLIARDNVVVDKHLELDELLTPRVSRRATSQLSGQDDLQTEKTGEEKQEKCGNFLSRGRGKFSTWLESALSLSNHAAHRAGATWCAPRPRLRVPKRVSLTLLSQFARRTESGLRLVAHSAVPSAHPESGRSPPRPRSSLCLSRETASVPIEKPQAIQRLSRPRQRQHRSQTHGRAASEATRQQSRQRVDYHPKCWTSCVLVAWSGCSGDPGEVDGNDCDGGYEIRGRRQKCNRRTRFLKPRSIAPPLSSYPCRIATS